MDRRTVLRGVARGRFIRPALLQEREGRRLRCLTCERRCRLVEGGTGWCRTRRNIGGVLHTLIYGAVSSVSANPIEKKPLYRFHPGTDALTCGSWGCNFGCPWCQNWEISKGSPPATGPFTSPAAFVEEAIRLGCQGTSISFNEPTLSLEWSLEVFRLARARGLCNTFVSNGYMTPEVLRLLVEAGLRFVYLGNVPGHPSNNTICPQCDMVLVERWGLAVLQNRLRDGSCPRCGNRIAGVWGPARTRKVKAGCA